MSLDHFGLGARFKTHDPQKHYSPIDEMRNDSKLDLGRRFGLREKSELISGEFQLRNGQ